MREYYRVTVENARGDLQSVANHSELSTAITATLALVDFGFVVTLQTIVRELV